MSDIGKYSDIINLPHHVSETHPQMPLEKRAAQFSPFAALTGYDDVVDETARLTEDWTELNEDRLAEIGWQLEQIEERMSAGEAGRARITWFVKDERKAGGAYKTKEVFIKKVDRIGRTLVITDGTIIPISDIMNLEMFREDRIP